MADKGEAPSDRDLVVIPIDDVESLTGIGRSMLLAEIRDGRLAACKIRGRWHLTRPQIAAWLKRVEVPAKES
jgi:hypothetical protein